VLKIDGSFIAGLGHDDRDRAIVESIVNLASTLHQIAVAEGVETRAQVDALRDMGCPMAQGYYFGRPVDAVDLEGNSSAPDRHATEPLGLVRSNETRR
jgi:EAL domain-containing protein (putative c-di-GMP-specific phosphodiesterase class I)